MSRCATCGHGIETCRPEGAVECIACAEISEQAYGMDEAEREATEAEESTFDAEHPASTGL